jgi:hypothetical protein
MAYVLTCTGDGGTTSKTVIVDVVLPDPDILNADFEAGAEGFSGTGRWARSNESAHGAGFAWSDSPGGNYPNSANATLWSPVFDLSGYASVTARFWHLYDFQLNLDFGTVVVNDGGAIVEIGSYTGTSNGWTQVSVDLSGFAGRTSVRLGFRITTNGSIVADGWHIDDVVVSGEERGTGFKAIAPCRLADTRIPSEPYGGQAIPGATSWFFPAAGSCGIPASARAIAVIVTVIAPSDVGYATLYPADRPRPLTSSISFAAGQVISGNAFIKLPLDGGGDYGVYNGSAGNAHVAVDVMGYFE